MQPTLTWRIKALYFSSLRLALMWIKPDFKEPRFIFRVKRFTVFKLFLPTDVRSECISALQHPQALGRAPAPGADGRAGDDQAHEVWSIWRSRGTITPLVWFPLVIVTQRHFQAFDKSQASPLLYTHAHQKKKKKKQRGGGCVLLKWGLGI